MDYARSKLIAGLLFSAWLGACSGNGGEEKPDTAASGPGTSSSSSSTSSSSSGAGGSGGEGASSGTVGSGGATSSGGATGSGGAGGSDGAEGGGGAGSTPPPTEFDNPVIKYDAPDPTSGPGDYIFTADGAAMVWNNKVYLYTGHDEQAEGAEGYRMFDWRLWTSSDMIHWENKGAVMRYDVFPWAHGGDSTGNANAGQVVERDDENGNPKFYFYAPVEGGQSSYGISIGVAVADRPEGPFKDARGIPLIFLADTNGTADHSWRNLDPTVFVDDDGRAYMYWGNGVLYWVELEDDMIHLKGETYTTDGSGKMQNRSISGVQIHVLKDIPGYTEAPYLSKHGSLYYLTYASGFPESISYATSTSPQGPWQHRGVILDPVPNSSTIHQSLFEFKGASYLTYHDAALPTGGSYRRSTCVDRAYYNDDGTIRKIVPTHR
ncbi:hypothetical protein predicted by Glimmer/Critica [Sorangium cellulosum So ce56]|uniref:Uncharacterized protein n=1 Tax=Sorangium cellulosum (strain So ce56) TaxID=448385 RepID=A9G8V7_SORC5|nr:glycoside hydrolase family 43 protein [Sorangium cellulosum]CAN99076.1 hypothetical protein predicted by Glimmer/Critica [Sorangium cellulosum So ce56]